MAGNHKLAWAVAGLFGFSISATAALAADLNVDSGVPTPAMQTVLPAVSGVNGKFEVLGGMTDTPADGTNGVYGVTGSLSVPLGDRLGFQGDLAATSINGMAGFGGAAHLFTRNPDQYLLGITGAVATRNGATIYGIGPEAELYLGNFSLEAFGGFARLNQDKMPDDSGVFAFADLAWYPTDNWRVALGGASVLGYNSVDFSTEYQVPGIGTSLTGKVRIGEDGAKTATAGVKFYFGGESSKSLIDRHRQDDPQNRSLDLFSAAGKSMTRQDPGDYSTEKSCTDAGYEYGFSYDTESYVCNYPGSFVR